MITIAILPEKDDSYRALAGEKESTGRTPGEALDALEEQLTAAERGALAIVQNHRADEFFSAAQQERLTELMQLRKARSLATEEARELESLVEAELHGARARAEAIAGKAAPKKQTPGKFSDVGLSAGKFAKLDSNVYRSFINSFLGAAKNTRFDEIVEHTSAVYDYALRKTGSRDVADDLVQGVCASIISRALHHSLEDIRDIKGYMLVMARDLLLEARRKDVKENANVYIELFGHMPEAARRQAALNQQSAENLIEAKELIENFMNKATEHEMQIFQMVFLEGLKSKEVAERLDSDVGTTRYEINKLRAKVRSLLKGRLVKSRR